MGFFCEAMPVSHVHYMDFGERMCRSFPRTIISTALYHWFVQSIWPFEGSRSWTPTASSVALPDIPRSCSIDDICSLWYDLCQPLKWYRTGNTRKSVGADREPGSQAEHLNTSWVWILTVTFKFLADASCSLQKSRGSRNMYFATAYSWHLLLWWTLSSWGQGST